MNTAPTFPLSHTFTLHYLSLSVAPYASDNRLDFFHLPCLSNKYPDWQA